MFELRLINSRTERVLLMVAAAGALAALLGLLVAPHQMWPSWLVAGQYVLGLGLGSLFFIALMVVCGAQWWERFRYVPETLARTLPWTGAMVLLGVVVGLPWLYGWSGHQDNHHAAPFRDFWLQAGFFRIRSLVYIALWLCMLVPVIRAARRTPRRVGMAAGFIVLFAVTFVLSSFDWLMSLDAHWFSTIFGVYNFAGAFLSAMAAIGLITILLRRRRSLVVSDDSLHDLGKLIHAFSVFWAYIWFSQYMLIWYANLPEETSYYLVRHAPGWSSLSLLNVALNWALPFMILLPRSAKRSETTLLQVCAMLLVGRAVDLYWMIIPPLAPAGYSVHVWALVTLAATVALMIVLISRRLSVSPTSCNPAVDRITVPGPTTPRCAHGAGG